jgi:hypothetical protein
MLIAFCSSRPRQKLCFLPYSRQAWNRNQSDCKKKDCGGDELQVAKAEIFKEQLGGNQTQRCVGEARQFDAMPAGAGKSQSQRECAKDERTNESDVMSPGSDPARGDLQ